MPSAPTRRSQAIREPSDKRSVGRSVSSTDWIVVLNTGAMADSRSNMLRSNACRTAKKGGHACRRQCISNKGFSHSSVKAMVSTGRPRACNSLPQPSASRARVALPTKSMPVPSVCMMGGRFSSRITLAPIRRRPRARAHPASPAPTMATVNSVPFKGSSTPCFHRFQKTAKAME